MGIHAGTVSAYLTLDTSKYLQGLKEASSQMQKFVDEGKVADSTLVKLKGTFTEMERSLGAGFTSQLRLVVSELQVLSDNYASFVSVMYDNKAFNTAAENLKKLSKEAEDAAAAVSGLGNSYAVSAVAGINDVVARRREALSSELADYNTAFSQKLELVNRESTSQINVAGKTSTALVAYYRTDGAAFKLNEAEKTEGMKKELSAREKDLSASLAVWNSILKSYVPVFLSVGNEYGDALLKGIQSTSGRISSYLTSVAAAVRAASDGGSFNINAYSTGTQNADSGLAVVGEHGMPEIVDFSGGEQVLSFRRSVELLGQAASSAVSYSEAVSGAFGASYNSSFGEPFDYDRLASAIGSVIGSKLSEQGGKSVVYSPTYNSPVTASIDELMRQDKLNMLRLGLAF